MMIFAKNMHNDPTLHSRAFQLALEVTYFKRRFNTSILQEIFKNDFIIKDYFTINNGLCDQSTIYSALLAKEFTNYFNLAKEDVIVLSTPLYNIKHLLTSRNEYYKSITGNSIPDLTLKETPYDFKDSKDILLNKNHIYFLDINDIQKKSSEIIYNLEKQILLLQKNANPQLKIYFKDIILILSTDKHPADKLNTIYSFMHKVTPPKEFRIPYIIFKKKANITELLLDNKPNADIEAVPLDHGKLNEIKSQKAIMGITEKWSVDLKDIIQKATQNSIQFHINNDTVD